jgi:hypothetical protein
MGVLWCANCPFRAESGMMPNVIRHTEQRGKGRLQDGQAVAFIFSMFSQLRADDLFVQRMKACTHSIGRVDSPRLADHLVAKIAADQDLGRGKLDGFALGVLRETL